MFPVRLSPSGTSRAQRGVCGRFWGDAAEPLCNRAGRQADCRIPTRETLGNQGTDPRPAPSSPVGALEEEPCLHFDMQQKSSVGVDMPQPYSRKGLGGWMTNASTRFPYKEKRVGKITEIGLTRLTHTPLSPTRSKAEACQPQSVFFAARHGHDHEATTSDRGGRGDRAPTPSPSIGKKTIKILLLSLIGAFQKNRGLIHNRPCFTGWPSRRRTIPVTLTCSRNHWFGLTCLSPTPVRV